MSDLPIILWGVMGLIFGSFGSVLVERLPRTQSITGRSQCPGCSVQLTWLNLVPVVSYLAQRGQCTACKNPISPLYLLLELGSAGIFVMAFLQRSNLPEAVLLAAALWLLFLMAIIDARTQGIPDALNLPFIGVSLFYGLITNQIELTAILLGAGFFSIQWIISRGRWVGSGDILLAIGIAALVGSLMNMLWVLMLSYIIGGAVACVLLLTKKKSRKDALAFGPFLAVATLIVTFWMK